ncbi:MAG: hypothetical protein NZ895_01205 [Archaeoglobaceae archaeon]|nr:hypothetical protein [Archaeoglobaceae archaeon]MCX8151698.1 hypothetical protein [Archaeoglobaceae archaeon]MDW8013024.1 hypothetical protein [Archaeoglobaceae archaeon]
MILIVGGGKVGEKASDHFSRCGKNFLIIDPDENCGAAKKYPENFSKASASQLVEIAEKYKPDFIIPAAPIHVAAEALTSLGFKADYEVAESFLSWLPSRIILSYSMGSVVVSYNRKMCLENCIQPEICPITKIKKPTAMYKLLEFCIPKVFVLVSESLAPGIGGFKGENFLEVVRKARSLEKIIVATACNCHGVVTALRK